MEFSNGYFEIKLFECWVFLHSNINAIDFSSQEMIPNIRMTKGSYLVTSFYSSQVEMDL